MAVVIDAIKARVALLAIVNAIGLILSGIGKISQETLQLWAEQVGIIFDAGLMIFGALALILPGILNYVKVNRPTHATLGLFLFCVFALPLFAGCETFKGAAGKVCYQDEKGNQICLPINQAPPPAPAQIQPLPPPNMPPLPESTLQLAK